MKDLQTALLLIAGKGDKQKMARKKKETPPPAPPPGPAPAAQPYYPPQPMQQPGPMAGQPPGYPPPPPPPPGAYGAPGGYPPGQPMAPPPITAPPPPQPRNPFVNAQVLWQMGGKLQGVVRGIRAATGGNNAYGQKQGWFLDLDAGAQGLFTARVNVGDVRHRKLFERFGPNWLSQTIVLRLPTPADNTKAAWVVD